MNGQPMPQPVNNCEAGQRYSIYLKGTTVMTVRAWKIGITPYGIPVPFGYQDIPYGHVLRQGGR
jgi:hypothetical protein